MKPEAHPIALAWVGSSLYDFFFHSKQNLKVLVSEFAFCLLLSVSLQKKFMSKEIILKTKTTLSNLEKKISLLFSAMKKNIKFAVYSTADGTVSIDTPSDVPAVNDTVLAAVNGEVVSDYSTDGAVVFIGEAGSYELQIEGGVIKSAEVVNADGSEQEPAEVETADDTATQMQAMLSQMKSLVEIQAKSHNENVTLRAEVKKLNERVVTLWAQSQKVKSKSERKPSSLEWMKKQF